MNHRMFLYAVLLIASFGASAQTTCDADFVKALRSNYSEASGGTLQDILFELACSKKVESKSTDASGTAIGYGDASYGDSSYSLAEACSKKDRKYFEKNSREITSAFLPPQAIDLLRSCFPGNARGLSLNVVPNPPQVVVTAEWVDPTFGKTPQAAVRSFRPSGAVTCESANEDFARGKMLGKISTVCTLSPNGAASFVVNTSFGSAYATVPPTPATVAGAVQRGVIPVTLFNTFSSGPGYLFKPSVTSRYVVALPSHMKQLVSVITWYCVGNCVAMPDFVNVTARKIDDRAIELIASGGTRGSATMGIHVEVEYR
jgi:hypothetical protein